MFNNSLLDKNYPVKKINEMIKKYKEMYESPDLSSPKIIINVPIQGSYNRIQKLNNPEFMLKMIS